MNDVLKAVLENPVVRSQQAISLQVVDAAAEFAPWNGVTE